MAECKTLRAYLLFDYHRISRKDDHLSGLDVLEPLTRIPRCKIFCFASPTLNINSFKSQLLPHKMRECFGVQHSKFVVFDDDVIITG